MWLHMTAGRGPEECHLAVAGLLSRLLEEAAAAEVKAEVLESVPAAHGLASALVVLDGAGAQAVADGWVGTVQWRCPSPLRPGWKRKQWFVGVSLLIPPEAGAVFDPKDVRYEPCRSSGPGGQHVNKTSTAIRATHGPTGLTVFAQEERSQHRNKRLAMARLARALAGKNADRLGSAKHELWSRHDELERGRAVRVYDGPHFMRVA